MVKNNIKNIIFIDSSARLAATAFKKYWQNVYPEIDCPGLFFVNPLGFKTSDDAQRMQGVSDAIGFPLKNSRLINTDNAREEENIGLEFAENYPQLMNDKDEPTMVLDTCAHTGETILPILRTLGNLGFSKVLTVLTSNHMCIIEPDIVLLEDGKRCRPYGRDNSVLKHAGSVTSLARHTKEFPDEEAHEAIVNARKKIQSIIDEDCK